MSAVGRGLGEEQERRDGNELGLFLAGLLLSPTHLSILLIFFSFVLLVPCFCPSQFLMLQLSETRFLVDLLSAPL